MDERTPYEQMIEDVDRFASMMHAYYEALVREGFSPENALLLTVKYQEAIITSISKMNPKTDT